jgi:hypothetical protein
MSTENVKPTPAEVHGAIITLDSLPIGQSHNPLEFLHKYQGQSADYALEHGGYAIVTQDSQVRGYMDYMTIRDRRGYGVNGHLIRSIESLQAVSLQNGGQLTNDAIFTDHVAAPQLSAIRRMLDYTDGALSNVNGALDAWIGIVAARFGLDHDDI